jgi:protein required for attachment to host cells
VYASHGAQRSGVSPRTDPERRMEEKFVTSLVEHLSAKAGEKAFDELIVAASPRALGAFRACAPKTLTERVSREIHGDYVNVDPERLLTALTS